jgi:D-proline reductase (dithiol) PrdB
MAELDDFSLPVRMFLKAYPWRRIDPVPWSPLRRPLAESRVALVSSAGLVLPGQPPFDPDVRGGDTSFRVIPREADVASLLDTHRSGSFDHSGVARDPNLAFPLDRLRELEAAGRIGRIGEIAPRHISFMGSITAPGRLVRDSAPAMAELLVQDQVDVALLVPV